MEASSTTTPREPRNHPKCSRDEEEVPNKRLKLDLSNVSSSISGDETKLQKASSTSEAKFESFVFLDIEATGLAKSAPKPRILEVALVALSRYQFDKYHRDLVCWKKRLSEGDSTLSDLDYIWPRVTNKLVLCFQPNVRVPLIVSDLTGLENHNLEDQKRFDMDSAKLILEFFQQLQKPICLIAHNGLSYDFSLLKAELEAAGLDINSESLYGSLFMGNTFCVDSLAILKKVFDQEESSDEKESSAELTGLRSLDTDGIRSEELKKYLAEFEADNWPGDDDDESNDAFTEPQPTTTAPKTPLKSNENGPNIELSPRDENNEITPDKHILTPLQVQAPRKRPKSTRRPRPPSLSESIKAKKRLNFSRPTSFALPKLYEHLFGLAPRISHGAEADCDALARICALKHGQFVEQAKPEAVRFSEVQKMW